MSLKNIGAHPWKRTDFLRRHPSGEGRSTHDGGKVALCGAAELQGLQCVHDSIAQG